VRVILGGAFFRDDRDTRRKAFEIPQNDSFRGLISRRDWRAIGFVAKQSYAALTNGCRRTGGNYGQILDQRDVCVSVEDSHG
jgi:hypothetical protein